MSIPYTPGLVMAETNYFIQNFAGTDYMVWRMRPVGHTGWFISRHPLVVDGVGVTFYDFIGEMNYPELADNAFEWLGSCNQNHWEFDDWHKKSWVQRHQLMDTSKCIAVGKVHASSLRVGFGDPTKYGADVAVEIMGYKGGVKVALGWVGVDSGGWVMAGASAADEQPVQAVGVELYDNYGTIVKNTPGSTGIDIDNIDLGLKMTGTLGVLDTTSSPPSVQTRFYDNEWIADNDMLDFDRYAYSTLNPCAVFAGKTYPYVKIKAHVWFTQFDMVHPTLILTHDGITRIVPAPSFPVVSNFKWEVETTDEGQEIAPGANPDGSGSAGSLKVKVKIKRRSDGTEEGESEEQDVDLEIPDGDTREDYDSFTGRVTRSLPEERNDRDGPNPPPTPAEELIPDDYEEMGETPVDVVQYPTALMVDFRNVFSVDNNGETPTQGVVVCTRDGTRSGFPKYKFNKWLLPEGGFYPDGNLNYNPDIYISWVDNGDGTFWLYLELAFRFPGSTSYHQNHRLTEDLATPEIPTGALNFPANVEGDVNTEWIGTGSLQWKTASNGGLSWSLDGGPQIELIPLMSTGDAE